MDSYKNGRVHCATCGKSINHNESDIAGFNDYAQMMIDAHFQSGAESLTVKRCPICSGECIDAECADAWK